MKRRYDDDRDDSGDDREISLGATSILGIFFALVLVCAVCFGVGYSMRGRQTPLPVAATETSTPSGTGQTKPSPASVEPPASAATAPEDSPAIVPTGSASTDTASTPQAESAAASAPAVQQVAAARVPAHSVVPGSAVGSAVVQVAAVSHREDADFLLAALKKRGYTAAIRQEPQDKLLHVQLGPFASKKDAVATRDRLLTDGYNPIIK